MYTCVYICWCVCLSVLCVYMCSPYLFSTSLIQSNLYKTWSNLSIYLNRTVQSHYAYIRIIYTHSSIEHIYAIHTFAKHKYVYISITPDNFQLQRSPASGSLTSMAKINALSKSCDVLVKLMTSIRSVSAGACWARWRQAHGYWNGWDENNDNWLVVHLPL